MTPTRIGIDLTEFPQKIGGFLLGRFIVVKGSKGLKLTGATASTTKEEVVAILKDAVDVAKGIFGAPNIDAAVIVIPNNTEQKHKDHIILYRRGCGFNMTQVIKEHTAVSAVYVENVQPKIATNLAIISLKRGIFEISVVTIVAPLRLYGDQYYFVLRAHETHPEVIDLDETSKDQKGMIGIIGEAAKALVADPFENVLAGILKNVVESLNIKKTEVDKVVFVGKASRSEKVRKAVKESFSKAEVWESGIDNPDEIVAYGAAYLSKKMPTNLTRISQKKKTHLTSIPTISQDPGQAKIPVLDPKQADFSHFDPLQPEFRVSGPRADEILSSYTGLPESLLLGPEHKSNSQRRYLPHDPNFDMRPESLGAPLGSP